MLCFLGFNQHCLEIVALMFIKHSIYFASALNFPINFGLIVLDVQLAKDMSTAAVRTIRKEIKDLYINIQSLQEKDKACGNGNGIMWVHLISNHPPQLFCDSVLTNVCIFCGSWQNNCRIIHRLLICRIISWQKR